VLFLAELNVTVIELVFMAAALLFVLGIKRMSGVKTAKGGSRLAAIGMFAYGLAACASGADAWAAFAAHAPANACLALFSGDVAATCELMRAVGYDSAFMFKYSARSGTKAFKWPETVSEEEKARRLQTIIALQEERSAAINRGLIGSTAEVLVEGPARRRAGWMAGKTPQFKTAVFPANGHGVGDLAPVRIVEATAHTLIGVAAPP